MEKNLTTGKFSCDFENGMYQGDIVAGVRHGQGRMEFNNYDLYEGNWENGLMHGIGKYKFWDKSKDVFTEAYQGEFYKGIRQGKGRMEYANHDVYFGTWQNDFRTGEGVCWFADGSMFHGIWKYDQMVRGVFRTSSGERYDGEFKKGKYHGYGKLFFVDGSWFEGVFDNDKPYRGILFTTKGEIINYSDGTQQDKTDYAGGFSQF